MAATTAKKRSAKPKQQRDKAPSHFSTYDKENHIVKSNLRELLTHYHVSKQTTIDGSIEYLSDAEFHQLPEDDREHYAPMTQQQLAMVAGLRIMAITEIANLQRNTVNIYHLSAIACALGIRDISKIISFGK